MGKLYTRSGDDGFTYGIAGSRMPKSHPLIEFYGALDEANSLIGLARSLLYKESQEYDGILRYFQELLFNLGFSITSKRPMITEGDVEKLEEIVDKHYEEPLKTFVLPAGPPGVAALHVARAVVRRAERRLVALKVNGFPDVDPILLKLSNRLSDALFAVALHASNKLGFTPEPVSPRASS